MEQEIRQVMIGCGAAGPMSSELRRLADELDSANPTEEARWTVAGNGVDAPTLELRFTVEEAETDWDVPLVDYGMSS